MVSLNVAVLVVYFVKEIEMADSKGGRSVPSPHSPEHYDGIETPPFKHDGDGTGPFDGSEPEHYPHHSDHVRKHHHGK
jgi:hypothetical protein